MNLQILVATMNQIDKSLVEKMNIKSNAIIINQCNKNEFLEFNYKGKNIKFISLSERGVGLSRNNALMRATSDICLFADDDVRYVDEYENIIIKAFKENPKADIIIFNVISENPNRPIQTTNCYSKVRWFNCLKYGAVRIAVKTDRIREVNIYFSLLFGGGAKYSAGEDSLFIAECIKKGLKVFASPEVIGYASQLDSTWFEGYTDKYFIDKGVFYSVLSKRWARIFCLQFIIRHYKLFIKDKPLIKAYKLMIKGTKMISKNM
jgi:glycosyltransferase involved in cell wall biosynthesis